MSDDNSSKHIRNFSLSVKTLFLIPLFLGLLARGVLFFQYFNSPFRFYHTVRGLDMMTLLAKGEKFIQGNIPFSPLNFLIYTAHSIFPAYFFPEGIIVLQMILGILTALLCLWITLMISGNKYTALFAGVIASLYAPVIIYETQILKTTVYLFCSLLAFSLLLYAKKKRFTFLWTSLAGFFALFPLWERFAGILYPATALLWIITLSIAHSIKTRNTLAHSKENLPDSIPSDASNNFKFFLHKAVKSSIKPILYFSAGMAVSVIMVTAVNKYHNQSSAGYIKANLQYILKTGSTKNADINGQSSSETVNRQEAIQPSEKMIFYLKKCIDILRPIQIPNNINYYFIRERLPIMKILLGPNLVIPIALTGFFILIINLRFLKKESIMFFYAFASITPIIMFLPLARYKTLLLPLIAFSSAYALYYTINARIKQKLTSKNFLFILILPVLFIAVLIQQKTISRYSTDIYVYSYAAVHLPVKLMEKGKFKEAESILLHYSQEIPDAPLIKIFLSSSFMGQGKFKDAELLLKNIPIPQKTNLKGRYFFNLAESLRLQNKNREAALYYKQVLSTPYAYAVTPEIKKFIRHYIESL